MRNILINLVVASTLVAVLASCGEKTVEKETTTPAPEQKVIVIEQPEPIIIEKEVIVIVTPVIIDTAEAQHKSQNCDNCGRNNHEHGRHDNHNNDNYDNNEHNYPRICDNYERTSYVNIHYKNKSLEVIAEILKRLAKGCR